MGGGGAGVRRSVWPGSPAAPAAGTIVPVGRPVKVEFVEKVVEVDRHRPQHAQPSQSICEGGQQCVTKRDCKGGQEKDSRHEDQSGTGSDCGLRAVDARLGGTRSAEEAHYAVRFRR